MYTYKNKKTYIMKKLFLLLVYTCLVITTNAQCDVHTDTLPNGNTTSNMDTLIVNIDMAVCDSIVLYIPNWMTSATFVSPTTTAYTGMTSKVLYPQDNGLWDIMDDELPYDVIFIELNFYTPVSVKETTVTLFSVYPNPATDQITINIGLDKFQVEVLTILGQVVLHEHNVKTLNIESLTNGVYIISITANGVRTNKRFIKQ